MSAQPAPTPFIADAVHQAGTQLPQDLTPPSARWRVVPNRKARRKQSRKQATPRKTRKPHERL